MRNILTVSTPSVVKGISNASSSAFDKALTTAEPNAFYEMKALSLSLWLALCAKAIGCRSGLYSRLARLQLRSRTGPRC